MPDTYVNADREPRPSENSVDALVVMMSLVLLSLFPLGGSEGKFCLTSPRGGGSQQDRTCSAATFGYCLRCFLAERLGKTDGEQKD